MSPNQQNNVIIYNFRQALIHLNTKPFILPMCLKFTHFKTCSQKCSQRRAYLGSCPWGKWGEKDFLHERKMNLSRTSGQGFSRVLIYTTIGAIIGDGDCKSWDLHAPVIWHNFAIFRTNCVILTTCIHATRIHACRGFLHTCRCCHVAWSDGESCEILLWIFHSNGREWGRE